MNGKGDYNFLLNNDDMTSTNPFANSGIPGVNTSDAFALPPGGGFVYDNPFTDMSSKVEVKSSDGDDSLDDVLNSLNSEKCKEGTSPTMFEDPADFEKNSDRRSGDFMANQENSWITSQAVASNASQIVSQSQNFNSFAPKSDSGFISPACNSNNHSASSEDSAENHDERYQAGDDELGVRRDSEESSGRDQQNEVEKLLSCGIGAQIGELMIGPRDETPTPKIKESGNTFEELFAAGCGQSGSKLNDERDSETSEGEEDPIDSQFNLGKQASLGRQSAGIVTSDSEEEHERYSFLNQKKQEQPEIILKSALATEMSQSSSDEDDAVDSRQFHDEPLDVNEPLLTQRVDQKFVDQVSTVSNVVDLTHGDFFGQKHSEVLTNPFQDVHTSDNPFHQIQDTKEYFGYQSENQDTQFNPFKADSLAKIPFDDFHQESGKVENFSEPKPSDLEDQSSFPRYQGMDDGDQRRESFSENNVFYYQDYSKGQFPIEARTDFSQHDFANSSASNLKETQDHFDDYFNEKGCKDSELSHTQSPIEKCVFDQQEKEKFGNFDSDEVYDVGQFSNNQNFVPEASKSSQAVNSLYEFPQETVLYKAEEAHQNFEKDLYGYKEHQAEVEKDFERGHSPMSNFGFTSNLFSHIQESGENKVPFNSSQKEVEERDLSRSPSPYTLEKNANDSLSTSNKQNFYPETEEHKTYIPFGQDSKSPLPYGQAKDEDQPGSGHFSRDTSPSPFCQEREESKCVQDDHDTNPTLFSQERDENKSPFEYTKEEHGTKFIQEKDEGKPAFEFIQDGHDHKSPSPFSQEDLDLGYANKSPSPFGYAKSPSPFSNEREEIKSPIGYTKEEPEYRSPSTCSQEREESKSPVGFSKEDHTTKSPSPFIQEKDEDKPAFEVIQDHKSPSPFIQERDDSKSPFSYELNENKSTFEGDDEKSGSRSPSPFGCENDENKPLHPGEPSRAESSSPSQKIEDERLSPVNRLTDDKNSGTFTDESNSSLSSGNFDTNHPETPCDHKPQMLTFPSLNGESATFTFDHEEFENSDDDDDESFMVDTEKINRSGFEKFAEGKSQFKVNDYFDSKMLENSMDFNPEPIMLESVTVNGLTYYSKEEDGSSVSVASPEPPVGFEKGLGSFCDVEKSHEIGNHPYPEPDGPLEIYGEDVGRVDNQGFDYYENDTSNGMQFHDERFRTQILSTESLESGSVSDDTLSKTPNPDHKNYSDDENESISGKSECSAGVENETDDSLGSETSPNESLTQTYPIQNLSNFVSEESPAEWAITEKVSLDPDTFECEAIKKEPIFASKFPENDQIYFNKFDNDGSVDSKEFDESSGDDDDEIHESESFIGSVQDEHNFEIDNLNETTSFCDSGDDLDSVIEITNVDVEIGEMKEKLNGEPEIFDENFNQSVSKILLEKSNEFVDEIEKIQNENLDIIACNLSQSTESELFDETKVCAFDPEISQERPTSINEDPEFESYLPEKENHFSETPDQVDESEDHPLESDQIPNTNNENEIPEEELNLTLNKNFESSTGIQVEVVNFDATEAKFNERDAIPDTKEDLEIEQEVPEVPFEEINTSPATFSQVEDVKIDNGAVPEVIEKTVVELNQVPTHIESDSEQVSSLELQSGPSSVIIESQEVPHPDQASFFIKPSEPETMDLPTPQEAVVEVLPESSSHQSPIFEEIEDANSDNEEMICSKNDVESTLGHPEQEKEPDPLEIPVDVEQEHEQEIPIEEVAPVVEVSQGLEVTEETIQASTEPIVYSAPEIVETPPEEPSEEKVEPIIIAGINLESVVNVETEIVPEETPTGIEDSSSTPKPTENEPAEEEPSNKTEEILAAVAITAATVAASASVAKKSSKEKSAPLKTGVSKPAKPTPTKPTPTTKTTSRPPSAVSKPAGLASKPAASKSPAPVKVPVESPKKLGPRPTAAPSRPASAVPATRPIVEKKEVEKKPTATRPASAIAARPTSRSSSAAAKPVVIEKAKPEVKKPISAVRATPAPKPAPAVRATPAPKPAPAPRAAPAPKTAPAPRPATAPKTAPPPRVPAARPASATTSRAPSATPTKPQTTKAPAAPVPKPASTRPLTKPDTPTRVTGVPQKKPVATTTPSTPSATRVGSARVTGTAKVPRAPVPAVAKRPLLSSGPKPTDLTKKRLPKKPEDTPQTTSNEAKLNGDQVAEANGINGTHNENDDQVEVPGAEA